MKVHLILEFTCGLDCRVHSVYIHREKALERVKHLYRARTNEYKHFHVIQKTLKGRIKKEHLS